MSITEQIMSTLVEAKKGNKEAARKFAIMCAAKDEHTIMKKRIKFYENNEDYNTKKYDTSKV